MEIKDINIHKKDQIENKNSQWKPSIAFNSNGSIVIRGRAIGLDKSDFKPALTWSKGLSSKKVSCSLALDYVNAMSIRQIVELFTDFSENKKVDEVEVMWHYEKEDESLFETAIILSELYPTFQFNIQKLNDRDFNAKMHAVTDQ